MARASTTPDVLAAYEADRAEARSAEGSPASVQGKTADTDGAERFTAPTLVFGDGLWPAASSRSRPTRCCS